MFFFTFVTVAAVAAGHLFADNSLQTDLTVGRNLNNFLVSLNTLFFRLPSVYFEKISLKICAGLKP